MKQSHFGVIVSLFALVGLLSLIGCLGCPTRASRFPHRPEHRLSATNPRTIDSVTEELTPLARKTFAQACQKAAISFPPTHLTLVVLKEEKRLEIWGADNQTNWYPIGTYTVLAASGKEGPKRKRGDRQVPEGEYPITALNPQSSNHLSLKVGYPDAEDISHSKVPRKKMGGDIYIHGDDASIGCVAIGDAAIEEVFTLVSLVKPENCRLLIAPWDLRKKSPPQAEEDWINARYARLTRSLKPLARL
jgi:hypothetical protein